MADDNPAERLRLSSVLARAGFEVIAVATGSDVVEAVAAWEPKVVILSWPLQGGGLELVRKLVEELGMGGRVLLISGLADLRDQHAALGAGATQYFVRPVDHQRLIAAIRRAA